MWLPDGNKPKKEVIFRSSLSRLKEPGVDFFIKEAEPDIGAKAGRKQRVQDKKKPRDIHQTFLNTDVQFE